MKSKMIFSIIALIIVLGLTAGLGYGYYQKQTFKFDNPIVTMEIEGYGTVKIELYPEYAPNTVKNFIKLINEEYYNGLTFHRVESDLLIQGGDYAGDGTGNTEYTIKGEFSANGYKENTLKYERGTLGLARQDFSYYASLGSFLIEEGYNSGYAQFFIMTTEMSGFNGNYTAFGKVIEGIEIIDIITNLETVVKVNEETGEETITNIPVDKPVITKMTVDTFGIEYGEPIVKKAFDINQFIMELYGISF